MKEQTTSMLNLCLNDDLNIIAENYSTLNNTTSTMTAWNWWQEYHYPQIIQSYPVYIQERAKDKGKQAYEIVKILKDKKLIKLEKISDFIDVMDELIKIL